MDIAPGELRCLLSIQKLLDSLLIIQEEFRAILFNNNTLLLSRPPLGHFVSDCFDRTIKALRVHNAIGDGTEQIMQWHYHLATVVTTLNPSQKTIGEGQIWRAKKSLTYHRHHFSSLIQNRSGIPGSSQASTTPDSSSLEVVHPNCAPQLNSGTQLLQNKYLTTEILL